MDVSFLPETKKPRKNFLCAAKYQRRLTELKS